ncbi:hypothetical protein NBRC110019_05180 [Neptunitalea chrysea]|uniref:N-acetyltransferase domain-containing protein n=1 Tax=Neptunitalea chrysea TaxID=1647581 RepID=A0A9W6B545_9FLAO|nr:hypothetical protein NBRC110019_05180 [Neptunitalea chrysea]
MHTVKHKIDLRNLCLEDCRELRTLMRCVDSALWKEDQIKELFTVFPEGQLVIMDDGKIVVAALSIIVNLSDFNINHIYTEITRSYNFSLHNLKGDVLYGIEVFINPEYRGLKLVQRLYSAFKELCETLNLKSIVSVGRIPNYNKDSRKYASKKYIEMVRMKELYDPVLSFQLNNDFQIKKIMKGYLEGDIVSEEYTVLMEWNNIYYEETPNVMNAKKSVVRLGLIQWQIHPLKDLEALFEQAKFFIDTVSGYGSDFILFTTHLMADYNQLLESNAIRELAKYSNQVREKFQEFAISYNINIIAGSIPFL